jgi:hypothetical protein
MPEIKLTLIPTHDIRKTLKLKEAALATAETDPLATKIIA